MRILGPIIRLQVQRSPLKVGFKPDRHYTPAPIVSTERLRLSPRGAVGIIDGEEIVDVHHRDHPQTRQESVEQGLSVGFTSHYAEMRERYGTHMTVGIAGESVIVDTPDRVRLGEIEGGLVILTRDGKERVRLTQVCVARPCKPFAGFAHGGKMVESEDMKATLQFLDDGTRGFLCVPAVTGQVEIEVGDVLAVM